METYQVIRTHISPYQAQDFIQTERNLLSSLKDVEYKTLEESQKNFPTILITNTHTDLKKLPPALLDQTKLIIHPNSGYDHFVADMNLWREIPVVIGHTIRAQAVAEYSLNCLFQTQKLPKHESWDKNRLWNRSLIKNSKICIFGYGHIGKIIAKTLEALGAKVSIVDPYQKSLFQHFDSWEIASGVNFHVVISAMSLNDSSFQIFDQKFFESLNPEVVFINGARGNLYHEEALRTFFTTHREAQCFLDVFPTEPITDNWTLPNVWKTSHIAGVHKHLDQGILDFEFNVLKDFLNRKDFMAHYQSELLQNKILKGMII